MGCDCSTSEFVVGNSPLAVTSSTAVFFPLTGPLPSVDIARVVARVRSENALGAWEAQFGYQVSSDLFDWTDGASGSFATIGAVWAYDTPGDGSYVTRTAAMPTIGGGASMDELFVRFGISLRQNSSGGLVAANFFPTFSFQNF